jgi:hypothetical protein
MSAIQKTGGTVSWTHQDGDKYVVTGETRDGRRFKQTHDNWSTARCINLWRGTKWLLRDGRKHRLQTVFN